MDKNKYDTANIGLTDKIKAELKELDKVLVEIDGLSLKPSQCYRFGTDPLHVLFNTNCPDGLKAKVEEILAKYKPLHENSSA